MLNFKFNDHERRRIKKAGSSKCWKWKQNVTTLNEKLDFSDLENVEGGTVKDFKDDEHLKSEGGNVGVGCVC